MNVPLARGLTGVHVQAGRAWATCVHGGQAGCAWATYLVPVTGTSPMARPDLGMILRELDVRACALIGSLQAMTCT